MAEPDDNYYIYSNYLFPIDSHIISNIYYKNFNEIEYQKISKINNRVYTIIDDNKYYGDITIFHSDILLDFLYCARYIIRINKKSYSKSNSRNIFYSSSVIGNKIYDTHQLSDMKELLENNVQYNFSIVSKAIEIKHQQMITYFMNLFSNLNMNDTVVGIMTHTLYKCDDVNIIEHLYLEYVKCINNFQLGNFLKFFRKYCEDKKISHAEFILNKDTNVNYIRYIEISCEYKIHSLCINAINREFDVKLNDGIDSFSTNVKELKKICDNIAPNNNYLFNARYIMNIYSATFVTLATSAKETDDSDLSTTENVFDTNLRDVDKWIINNIYDMYNYMDELFDYCNNVNNVNTYNIISPKHARNYDDECGDQYDNLECGTRKKSGINILQKIKKI